MRLGLSCWAPALLDDLAAALEGLADAQHAKRLVVAVVVQVLVQHLDLSALQKSALSLKDAALELDGLVRVEALVHSGEEGRRPQDVRLKACAVQRKRARRRAARAADDERFVSGTLVKVRRSHAQCRQERVVVQVLVLVRHQCRIAAPLT